MAGLGVLNLTLLDAASLGTRFLPSILPPSYQGRPAVRWDGTAPSAVWVATLWTWLQVGVSFAMRPLDLESGCCNNQYTWGLAGAV